MPRSKSSNRWLQEHFNDAYVKQALSEGYRSRAFYKLKEIDEKEALLKPGMTVVDLGAAPGGWSQYVTKRLDGAGIIIALDRLPMDCLSGVTCITGDFSDDQILQQLTDLIPQKGVDLVLSDMAPNFSGNMAVDIPKAMDLAEQALDFAQNTLVSGGALLMKVFHGAGFDGLIKQVRTEFKRVSVRKPQSSRSRSRETYLLAKGYNL